MSKEARDAVREHFGGLESRWTLSARKGQIGRLVRDGPGKPAWPQRASAPRDQARGAETEAAGGEDQPETGGGAT